MIGKLLLGKSEEFMNRMVVEALKGVKLNARKIINDLWMCQGLIVKVRKKYLVRILENCWQRLYFFDAYRFYYFFYHSRSLINTNWFQSSMKFLFVYLHLPSQRLENKRNSRRKIKSYHKTNRILSCSLTKMLAPIGSSIFGYKCPSFVVGLSV